jgi:hypothetical protein
VSGRFTRFQNDHHIGEAQRRKSARTGEGRSAGERIKPMACPTLPDRHDVTGAGAKDLQEAMMLLRLCSGCPLTCGSARNDPGQQSQQYCRDATVVVISRIDYGLSAKTCEGNQGENFHKPHEKSHEART